MDYRIVNRDGLDTEGGEYCYVRDFWIHPKYRRKLILEEFVKEEHLKYPQVIWIYFDRRGKGRERNMKMYNIRRFYEV